MSASKGGWKPRVLREKEEREKQQQLLQQQSLKNTNNNNNNDNDNDSVDNCNVRYNYSNNNHANNKELSSENIIPNKSDGNAKAPTFISSKKDIDHNISVDGPNSTATTTTTSPTTIPEKTMEEILGYRLNPDDKLSLQSCLRLKKAELTCTSGIIMSRQPTIAVSVLGSFSHGKSSLVKLLSTVNPPRFRSERSKIVAIELGYANAKIYKALSDNNNHSDINGSNGTTEEKTSLHVEQKEEKEEKTHIQGLEKKASKNKPDVIANSDHYNNQNGSDNSNNHHIPIHQSALKTGGKKRPECFISHGSDRIDLFASKDGTKYKLVRHVGLIDCPFYDILITAMLNGAAIMDAALLVIGANESCPQPQTQALLAALEVMQVKNIIVVQNKVDMLDRNQAIAHYQSIQRFIQGTIAANAPIIPVSSKYGINVDVINEYLVNYIPVPLRDYTSSVYMLVLRSFDVNESNKDYEELQGGIAGGVILRGVLMVGQKIEVRPGIVHRDKQGKVACQPIKSIVTSLYSEKNNLQFATPGGFIGVGTNIDPFLTLKDRLVGQVLGDENSLPPVWIEITIEYHLLSNDQRLSNLAPYPISPLTIGEPMYVNVGPMAASGRVSSLRADKDTSKNEAVVELLSPICTEIGSRLSLSRFVERQWKLIAWGHIIAAKPLNTTEEDNTDHRI